MFIWFKKYLIDSIWNKYSKAIVRHLLGSLSGGIVFLGAYLVSKGLPVTDVTPFIDALKNLLTASEPIVIGVLGFLSTLILSFADKTKK